MIFATTEWDTRTLRGNPSPATMLGAPGLHFETGDTTNLNAFVLHRDLWVDPKQPTQPQSNR